MYINPFDELDIFIKLNSVEPDGGREPPSPPTRREDEGLFDFKKRVSRWQLEQAKTIEDLKEWMLNNVAPK